MRKILIAGAGHGGLTAAVLLAKKGYDITVIEKNNREDTGYDWHDMMYYGIFDEMGIPRPRIHTMPSTVTAFLNPSKTVRLHTPELSPDYIYIHRRDLLNFLIEQCENAGVKFLFETEVLSALYSKERVYGLHIKNNGICNTLYADIVIDSAGANSSVRKSLPCFMNIKNEFNENELFSVYRAYFKKKANINAIDKNTVYFYHCNRPGMDWAIDFDTEIDILIGSFSHLTDMQITEALEDFDKDYIAKSNKIVCGDRKCTIPLSCSIPLMVTDGYCAVGDSASMTEPLSGSGITLSMYAGIYLAETIENIGNGDFTTANLWEYQYKYLKNKGNAQLDMYNVRKLVTSLTAEDVDRFLISGILTEKEIRCGGLKDTTPKELLNKIIKLIPMLHLTPCFIKFLIRSKHIKNSIRLLPEKYDKEKVEKWLKEYRKICITPYKQP